MMPLHSYELLPPSAAPAIIPDPDARCPHCGGALDPVMKLMLERVDGVERVVHWICSVEEGRG